MFPGENPSSIGAGGGGNYVVTFLEAPPWKQMTFVEWWSHGSGAELRRRRGDGGRGGGSGRWMYAEEAASDSDVMVPLWGRVAVVHCFGGDLVLRGQRGRRPGRCALEGAV